jgi:hypothetical protein
MNREELGKQVEQIDSYFEAYPQEEMFHFTSDGQAFLHSNKSDAVNHQRTLDATKQVLSISRKQWSKIKSGEILEDLTEEEFEEDDLTGLLLKNEDQGSEEQNDTGDQDTQLDSETSQESDSDSSVDSAVSEAPSLESAPTETTEAPATEAPAPQEEKANKSKNGKKGK